MAPMDLVALLVLLLVAAVTLWAWSQRPGARFIEDFATIWGANPWGKQLLADFSGLAVVLVLWMTAHAYETGSWLVYSICVATMPLFGAMSAAAYWLLAVSN